MFLIGVAKNYVQATLDIKKDLTIVILDKLRELQCFFIIVLLMILSLGLAAGMPVPRMYYTNFDRAITEKYHVILEGWPLEKFCSPSEIASRNEVSVLMALFESGTTHFRKLSPTEFEKWSEERHSTAVESMTGPVATVTSSSPLPPDPAPTQEPPVPAPSAPLPSSQDSISNKGTGALTMTEVDPDVENIPPSSNPAKRK